MAESREIGSKKSGFCAIVERLSCTTMQYYMYWKQMECQLNSTRSNQLLEFSEMVQFRRCHCSSFLKRPWIIVQLSHCQLLKNSSSRMHSQGPNDRVHARVINISSRWVSVWTQLLTLLRAASVAKAFFWIPHTLCTLLKKMILLLRCFAICFLIKNFGYFVKRIDVIKCE